MVLCRVPATGHSYPVRTPGHAAVASGMAGWTMEGRRGPRPRKMRCARAELDRPGRRSPTRTALRFGLDRFLVMVLAGTGICGVLAVWIGVGAVALKGIPFLS